MYTYTHGNIYTCIYIVYLFIYINRHTRRYKEMYYKELTHATMEVDKSQDLQSAGWSPKRGEVPG